MSARRLHQSFNMYHSQVNEYKYEIERLGRELQDLKKKLLPVAQASPGWAASAAESMLTHQHSPFDMLIEEYIDIDGEPKPHLSSRGVTSGKLSIKSHPSSGPRFSGGGFNMSTGVHHLTKPSADYRDNVDSNVCCDENAKKGTPDQLSYSNILDQNPQIPIIHMNLQTTLIAVEAVQESNHYLKEGLYRLRAWRA
ncbi:hypothetical protein BASA60_002743 [Batrachochytrium salamandrivorans]|nr:hypothetical protein BASA60_002743 [Batrachochytrium salamandrivorans]